ncbi:hypothetical protein C451_01055 [Halococcus thailandensis JCM 13552]|uniref:Uncharacterized protein n=1 Tax=Halococcus thailandensis JCM 13552 TaxID=1227457 RepID=M0NHY4_9EURY|nr:hypothetical protein C451_01055 [Halococcus thailandensis JCM 13552]
MADTTVMETLDCTLRGRTYFISDCDPTDQLGFRSNEDDCSSVLLKLGEYAPGEFFLLWRRVSRNTV